MPVPARILGARAGPRGLINRGIAATRVARIHPLPVDHAGGASNEDSVLVGAALAIDAHGMLNAPLAAEASTAGAATTAAMRWWDAVNADQLEEAAAIASEIVVPPLSNTFSFDDEEEGDGGGGGLGELGGNSR